MMPMRPTTRADRLVSLVPRCDRHVGHQALFLPVCEVFKQDRLDLTLAGKVVLGDGSEECLLASLAQRLLRDPLDAIQALLEDIVRPRNEV